MLYNLYTCLHTNVTFIQVNTHSGKLIILCNEHKKGNTCTYNIHVYKKRTKDGLLGKQVFGFTINTCASGSMCMGYE